MSSQPGFVFRSAVPSAYTRRCRIVVFARTGAITVRFALPLLAFTLAGCGVQATNPAALSTSDFEALKAWSKETITHLDSCDDNANVHKAEVAKADQQLKAMIGKKATWNMRVRYVDDRAVGFDSAYGRQDRNGEIERCWLSITFRGEPDAAVGPVISKTVAAKVRAGETVSINRKIRSAKIDSPHGFPEVAIDLD